MCTSIIDPFQEFQRRLLENDGGPVFDAFGHGLNEFVGGGGTSQIGRGNAIGDSLIAASVDQSRVFIQTC